MTQKGLEVVWHVIKGIASMGNLCNRTSPPAKLTKFQSVAKVPAFEIAGALTMTGSSKGRICKTAIAPARYYRITFARIQIPEIGVDAPINIRHATLAIRYVAHAMRCEVHNPIVAVAALSKKTKYPRALRISNESSCLNSVKAMARALSINTLMRR